MQFGPRRGPTAPPAAGCYAGAMHDVAIAGASVAGAATAIHLAQRGHSVVLLDRATFPRRKACGEGLFPAGVRELESIGVLERFDEPPARLAGIRFRADRHVAEAPLASVGVSRLALDAALLAVAAESGVDVRTGVTVRHPVIRERRVHTLATSAGEIAARAFVAADGLHSPMRRFARLDGSAAGKRYGISAHMSLATPVDPVVDVTIATDHELYITPTGPRTANVALLLRREQMRRFAGRLVAEYGELIGGHPLLAGACLLDEPKVAGPFPRTARRAWRANLVLAGDAAGFFDAISGEGMSVALVGARLCAAALSDYLDTGSYEPFREYDRQRRALVRNSDLLARLSLLLGSHERSAGIAVRNLSRRPDSFAKLVAINTGEAPLTALRPRDLSALLAGI